MTPDQRTRLAAVSVKLAEVVIADVDPANWTANGITLGKMTKEQRGDAAWCRKTAVQSVALLVRVEQLLAPESGPHPPTSPPEDPEAEITRAEKRAAALVQDLTDRISRAPAAR